MSNIVRILLGIAAILFVTGIIWGTITIRNNRKGNTVTNNTTNTTETTNTSSTTTPATTTVPATTSATPATTTPAKSTAKKATPTKTTHTTYEYVEFDEASATASAGVDANGNAWAKAEAN